MGLFNFTKKQLLSVIEWQDDSKETLVYRYPLTNRDEIMNSSTLIVRPSQVALFIHKGQVCDVFAPGSYKLASENIPLLTKLLSLPTGFNSPIKAEVYFVNTKQMTGQKWGTQNPIMMRDKEFGNIRLRAFGVYSYKVKDAKKFMEEMFGTNEVYTASDVNEHIRPIIVSGFSDAVAESKIGALDLASNYKEFGKIISASCEEDFEKLGLKISSLVVENISLPEEVEAALDERTKLGVLGDKMGTYTQYQAAQAMRDAAQNQSGGNMAGLGIGLGAGVGIGNLFAESLKTAADVEPAKDKSTTATKECPKCHATIKASAKFCPECGEKQAATKHCSACGAEVKATAKFCPECGEKL